MLKHRVSRPPAAFFCAALAVLLLGGCALPSPVPLDDSATAQSDTYTNASAAVSAESGSYLVNVTDMAGNAVRMDNYASRIAVLDPGDCELLCAMGASEQIVARGALCDYPGMLAAIPIVESDDGVETELLLNLTPDVVILSADYAADGELVSTLQSAGIPIVVTGVADFNSLYTDITLLGAVSNHASEASTLIASLVTSFAGIQSKATADGTKTIYFELGTLEEGYQTAGSGTLFNDVAVMLGYRNEFEDMSGYVTVTAAQIIGRSPDVIVTIAPEAADGTGGVNEILARTGWESVQAIADQRVYYVDGALITRHGPRLVDGMNALYTALYETPAQ